MEAKKGDYLTLRGIKGDRTVRVEEIIPGSDRIRYRVTFADGRTGVVAPGQGVHMPHGGRHIHVVDVSSSPYL